MKKTVAEVNYEIDKHKTRNPKLCSLKNTKFGKIVVFLSCLSTKKSVPFDCVIRYIFQTNFLFHVK